MKTSQAGIDLICQFEGFRSAAYPDPATGGDPWTIGYGHTSAAGPPTVSPGMVVTTDGAKHILASDLAVFEKTLNAALTRTPNQNQFDAMVSLIYNIGAGNFKQSTVLHQFNAGNNDAAANGFALWCHAAGKVLPGLVARRGKELALFKTPSVLPPAPAPATQPQPPATGVQPTEKKQMDINMLGGVVRAVVPAIISYFVGKGVLPAGDYAGMLSMFTGMLSALWSIHTNMPAAAPKV